MLRQRLGCDDRCDRSQFQTRSDNQLKSWSYELVSSLYKGMGTGDIEMNHLNNIATRQRTSRLRDAIFAGFVMLGAAMSITTISTAANAASTHRSPVALRVAAR